MKLDKAELVVDGLKEAGIDFDVGVPDAQFTQVYQMLSNQSAISYIGAANQGEAAGSVMGVWFDGKKPTLIIATSGLLVAMYWLARMQLLHEVLVLI